MRAVEAESLRQLCSHVQLQANRLAELLLLVEDGRALSREQARYARQIAASLARIGEDVGRRVERGTAEQHL